MNMHRNALVLITVITFVTLSQSQKQSNGIKVNDIEEFFHDFGNLKEAPQRDEFETLETYGKRLPKPLDTSKVVYLRIKESTLAKSYSYDIENGLLTFAGGKKHTDKFRTYQPSEGTPVEIFEKVTIHREYEASNAFGTTVTVQEIYAFHYVLNLVNLGLLPDSIFDRDMCKFKLSVTRLPKEAEKLSKSISLVIGFKPIDPKLSDFECFYISKGPTIDAPREGTFYHHIIDAKFVSILLYDEKSKRVILQYNM